MGKRIGIQTEHSDGVGVLVVEDDAIHAGERLLVQGENGTEVARVLIGQVTTDHLPDADRVERVVRRLSARDEDWLGSLHQREEEALRFAREQVRELDLAMKISAVSLDFDGQRGTFYFTAPQRVDFRQLVRVLAQRFKIRVEMRQIGVRDEGALLGGLGPCGNDLCCSQHMHDFPPVNVRMAREQGVEPNSNSATGMCGRLKCCLRFEFEEEAGEGGGAVSGCCHASCAEPESQRPAWRPLRGPFHSTGEI